MWFQNKEDTVIRRLETFYVPWFQTVGGQSFSDAKDIFDGMIHKAQSESKNNPLPFVGANGYLHLAQADDRLRKDLEWKKEEGVTEHDLHWWWDMLDLERSILFQTDHWLRFGHFSALMTQGQTSDEAFRLMKQANAIYAYFVWNSNDPRDENYPLPAELRDRVNRRTEREMLADPSGAQWTTLRDSFSSFNAFVRHEIKAGRI